MAKPSAVFVIAAARFAVQPEALLNPSGMASEVRTAFQEALAPLGLLSITEQEARHVMVKGEPGAEALNVQVVKATVLQATDLDGNVAVSIDPSGVSARANGDGYVNHEWLSELLAAGLTSLDGQDTFPGVIRLGLRYVDAIIPSPGRVLADYLVNPLDEDLGTMQLPGNMAVAEQMQLMVLVDAASESRLVVKSIRGTGEILLPADLLQDVISPTRPHSADGFVVLDLDHFIERQDPLSASATLVALGDLHAGTEATFRSLLTENAQQEWGVSG